MPLRALHINQQRGEGFGESEGAMHFRKAGNLIPKKLQNQKQRTRALVGGDRQEHSGALRTGKDQKFQGS